MSIRLQELEEKLLPVSEYIRSELKATDEESRNVIQKGLLLFRQHLVSNVKVRDEAAFAEVQDVTPVTVKLDLTFPLLSKCSCPHEKWCRHRMATFFVLYNKVGRVSEWLTEWRSSNEGHPSNAKAGSASSLQDLLTKHSSTGALRKASDLLKERKTRGNSPEEWWMFFETVVSDEDMEVIERQSYMIDIHIQNFYKRLMKDAPFEREWKPLYQLFATFYLSQTIDAFVQKQEIQLDKNHYSMYDFLLAEMEEAIRRLAVHAMPFSFDPYINFLKNKTVEFSSSSEQSTMVKADIYRFLWFFLFKTKQWRRQEVERLKAADTQDTFGTVALLHQYLLLDDFDHAYEQFDKLGLEIIHFADFWLEQFFYLKKYDTAVFVLKQLAPKLADYMNGLDDYYATQFARWFFRILPMDWLAENQKLLLKELLLSLLPYSFFSYSQFLLSAKDYRAWVELQIYMNYSIQEMEGMGLKDVAKDAPELVLPLYHEGIIHYIEQKNRDSYKKAVRYLKRLRTLYKKLKHPEKWEAFFAFILEKNKRLRAFQEECRKGKLIDA